MSTLEERKQKLRIICLEIAEIFPNVNFDLIISAVLATKDKEKAIDLVMQNLGSENTTAAPQQSTTTVAAAPPVEEKIIVPKNDIVKVPTIEKPLDEKQVKKMKHLKKILPHVSEQDIEASLKSHNWNVDDAASDLILSHPAAMEDNDNVADEEDIDGSNDEDYDDADIEFDADTVLPEDFSTLIIVDQEIEETDVEKTEWYQTAFLQQQEYLKMAQAQVNDDFALAVKMQQEEFDSSSPSDKDSSSDVEATVPRHRLRKKVPVVQQPEYKQSPLNTTINYNRSTTTNPKSFYNSAEPEDITGAVKVKSLEGFNAANFWTNHIKLIQDRFGTTPVHGIEHIQQSHLTKRFVAFWSQHPDCVIAMAFHGTHSGSINGIIENGLLIPGKGNSLHVVHGSALGLGIYLALDPHISVSYCGGGNQMFCCAVLISKKFHTTRSGAVLVAFEEKQVLPCFLVRFGSRIQVGTNAVRYSNISTTPHQTKEMKKARTQQLRERKQRKKLKQRTNAIIKKQDEDDDNDQEEPQDD